MKNKIVIFIFLVTIAISSYYIKEQYFYNGSEYVGEWVSDKKHITISHQGNHFIFKWNDTKFYTAHLTHEQELQIGEQKLDVITYLAADDAIQFAGSYYKRNISK